MNLSIRSLLTLGVMLGALAPPAPAQISRLADAPGPLSPADSARRVELPPGFRLDLLASEPVVVEPSGVAVDEHGRVFVTELHGYNLEGELDVRRINQTGELDREVRRLRWELMGGELAVEAARGQYGVVKLLVDPDGDGHFEHAIPWAENLPPCYGLVPARGGIVVACAPHVIFLADRDGDGHRDQFEILYTGFDVRVLERGINNPRQDLDGWIVVGSGGHGGTITGYNLPGPVKLGSTDFRIRPDGSAIEPVTGRVGTFGLAIDDFGHRFPTSGGRPAIHALPLPHRSLVRNPHVPTPATQQVIAGHHRGFRISQPHPWRTRRRQDPRWVEFYGEHETDSRNFSGGSSNEIYSADLFPPRYRGSLFYCEPSLNLIHRTVLERDGATFRARRAPGEETREFLASRDVWFRPTVVRTGPHGGLLIVDMYREIIEDYSAIPRFLQQQYGLDRGRGHGRLWRLVPEGAPGWTPPRLSSRKSSELVALLGDANAWKRRTAQRLLVEREARETREALVRQVSPECSPLATLHSLYTLAGLDVLEAKTLTGALDHPHPGVRLHALRLAGPWLDREEALLDLVLASVPDPDPSVRLEQALTLGESGSDRATAALLELALAHGGERWMDAAILSSSVSRAPELLRALSGDGVSERVRAKLLPGLATTLAARPDPVDLSAVLAELVLLEPTLARRVLEGLHAGLERRDRPLPREARDGSALLRGLARAPEELGPVVARLARHLDVPDSKELEPLREAARKLLGDREATAEDRVRALRQLDALAPEPLRELVAPLLDPREPPAVQAEAMRLLTGRPDSGIPALLLEAWPRLTPDLRREALGVLFSRSSHLVSLLVALERGTVRAGSLSPVQVTLLERHDDPEIRERARRLLQREAPTAGDLHERLERYRQALTGKRDLDRGRRVFLETCAPCHRLGDEGHAVGPSLEEVRGRPEASLLLDILSPDASLDPRHATCIVVTRRGEILTGLLASESPTSLLLRQESGQEVEILRRDILSFEATSSSFMPSDLHEKLSPSEMADLLGHLRHRALPDS